MSGKLFSLLGPVRKRVNDRVDEADVLLQEGDIGKLRAIQIKLASNTTTS